MPVLCWNMINESYLTGNFQNTTGKILTNANGCHPDGFMPPTADGTSCEFLEEYRYKSATTAALRGRPCPQSSVTLHAPGTTLRAHWSTGSTAPGRTAASARSTASRCAGGGRDGPPGRTGSHGGARPGTRPTESKPSGSSAGKSAPVVRRCLSPGWWRRPWQAWRCRCSSPTCSESRSRGFFVLYFLEVPEGPGKWPLIEFSDTMG